MGVRGVMVATVIVIVMVMVMVMLMGDGNTIRLAGPCAFPFTQRAAFGQPFHVVVVALLDSADILLKAQHLSPVLAQGAVHGGIASENLLHPLFERVHHQWVLPEVAGGEKVHLGVVRCHPIGVLADAAHQNP